MHSLGGFPYSVEHMAGEGHVRVNRLKPRTPVLHVYIHVPQYYMYTEHAQFVDVIGAVNTFVEGTWDVI